MIKRSESKTASSNRNRSNRLKKKRRLFMEGLEKRELLAVMTDAPSQPSTDITEYTSAQNIGAVQAFTFNESETTVQTGINDILSDADFVPLGTGAGQQDTVDVVGAVPSVTNNTSGSGFSSDIDTFAFDLRGGDILDAATLGGAGGVTLRDSNGSILVGNDVFIGGNQFPLQSLGNANVTYVIPEDGRYAVTVSPAALDTTGNYTLGLRVYRPTSEQLAIGDSQILYLDFAGDLIDNNIFNDALIQANPGLPVGGVTRVRSLADSLPILGLEFGDINTANRIIDSVVDETVRIFENLSNSGNGDYETTGTPGDYGIRILNSRDHGGQVSLDDPRLTRLLIGGTGTDFGVAGVFGIANSVDIGNFDLSEFGIFALDAFAATAATVNISPGASQIDLISQFLASVAAHEAGHTFGMIHTDNTDSIDSLSDAGGTQRVQDYGQGLGPDGIFGTLDDIDPIFQDDFFQPTEVPQFGFNKVRAALSHSLATGTVGAGIAGQVFEDINGDGSNAGDSGLAGVTVFADVNGNGSLDEGEPSTVTGAAGGFGLSAASGSVNVIAVTPTSFGATTPTSVNVNIGSTSAVNFGFRRIDPAVTGRVFVDADGDGFRDEGDPGLEGVYAYLDLDGDDRPDIGEPGTNTDEDGNYRLNFPGAGPFTIRIVVPPGFEFTNPTSGEYTNGTPTEGNFDFGLLASQDFGDAPDSYGTTVAADGARHGITAGLTIGALVDRESEGQPSPGSDGDDLNGSFDDEDGITILKAIAPEKTVLEAIGVTVTNTSGSPAFLVGFLDIDGNGTFDADEQIVTDRMIPSGTVNQMELIDVTLPSTAETQVGDTVVRFRLSQTAGLGPKGFAEAGEVEDQPISIQISADLASPDEFTVPRNSSPMALDVLANDFQSSNNELFITNLDLSGLPAGAGSRIRISPVPGTPGAKFITYAPPTGFIGLEEFTYFVVDEGGNTASTTVSVNVQFQSLEPIALDDSFEVPVGSVNRALNVLDNDVPSIFGGISVASVSPGSEGGTLTIVGGGQSIRYTPLPGFNGTEQFTYSVVDAAGSTSMATVTLNLLPGSREDDQVAFTIGIFDDVNTSTPISNVQVGDEFNVRLMVDDIRALANPIGVSSAFLDLLYTDELLAPVLRDNGDLDITFGSLFSSLQLVNFDTPGLIDEVGGVQSLDMPQEQQIDPDTGEPIPFELFTLKMVAVGPGVAVLNVDPADEAVSETILLESDVALTPAQLRLDRAELLITPSSDVFTAAVDDSFPSGVDSNGNAIISTSPARNVLQVLNNDTLAGTGNITEFGLVTSPTFGNAFVDDNGTPETLNDDFISYRPNANATGLEQFRYVIVVDGIRSTAEVTIALGNQNADADVAFTFDLVSGDGSGTPLDQASVSVGDRVGVQITVDDVRRSLIETFVFAGFLDLLYDSDVLSPADTNPSDGFDFDVVFESPFLANPDVNTTASRPGIIDELGSSFASAPTQISDGEDPAVLGTVFFDVIGTGDAGVVGSPADSFPFSDTLLFQEDDPVDVSAIRFSALDFTVPTSTLQNSSLRQDVNADGFVTPIDALLIINQVSRNGEGETAIASRHYTDVNGDNVTTALDALQVINYLQRASLEAEGELLAAPVSSGGAASASQSADEVFAEATEEIGKVVSTDIASSGAAANNAVVGNDDASDDDDDDDDVLNLLADDVSGLWG